MSFNQYLNNIISHKQKEAAELLQHLDKNPEHPINAIFKRGKENKHLFKKAMVENGFAVIAEIKRHSPSRGSLKKIDKPSTLALEYCQGGANAISVLTDASGFHGSLKDLEDVSKAIPTQIPTLRKDFIIHPIQLAEAVYADASCVLLIVSVLSEKLSLFLNEAKRLGLDVLTEVHTEDELDIALNANADIIGINHRNLKTFEIDMTLSERLIKRIPKGIISIAESGIHTPQQARQMKDLGFNGILVGEALVRSPNPAQLIAEMKDAAQ